MRKGAFSGNLNLQLSDFSAAASSGSTRDLFSPLTFSWYKATLSSTNLSFIQKVGITQFRLQFAKDDNDDLSADYVKFFSGNCSDSSSRPVLIVTYYMP
jgi:hypothetical protein